MSNRPSSSPRFLLAGSCFLLLKQPLKTFGHFFQDGIPPCSTLPAPCFISPYQECGGARRVDLPPNPANRSAGTTEMSPVADTLPIPAFPPSHLPFSGLDEGGLTQPAGVQRLHHSTLPADLPSPHTPAFPFSGEVGRSTWRAGEQQDQHITPTAHRPPPPQHGPLVDKGCVHGVECQRSFRRFHHLLRKKYGLGTLS